MESQHYLDDLSMWESTFGLQDSSWAVGLFDDSQEESRIGHIKDGDSIWKDTSNPLKEASNDVVSDRLSESFCFDFEKDGWLDEKTDIGALLDNLIKSPAFDEALNTFDESGMYLGGMNLADEPAQINENPTEIKLETISTDEEATSDSNVEIETDEIALGNTVVIYVEQSDPYELSTSSNDHIHILADTIEPPVEAVISPLLSTTNETEFMRIDNISGTESVELTSIEFPKEIAVLNDLPSTSAVSNKAKRGRKPTRVEPCRNVRTKSSRSSTCSSAPVSPSSVDYSDDSDEQRPPTTKRKERKKCQNRNAATKYRQKKRAETEAISNEEQDLENKNKDLKEQVQALETEVNYLKGFMREIMIARGLLKK